ncbi:MAG: hypothetical protein DHS20C18_35850 [Saprospiraceae bacterium]|nr:MAG: hypothetical protein DHS20C18_35850 [Saprospiraceae bacterium]
MKNAIFILLAIATVLSCTPKDGGHSENDALVGKWKLTAQLMDIGDGSGTFNPVVSEKTIEFLADGSVTSNGSLCQMTDQPEQATKGTYATNDLTISPTDCSTNGHKIFYELKNSELIISYPCIEPCRHKYVKVN